MHSRTDIAKQKKNIRYINFHSQMRKSISGESGRVLHARWNLPSIDAPRTRYSTSSTAHSSCSLYRLGNSARSWELQTNPNWNFRLITVTPSLSPSCERCELQRNWSASCARIPVKRERLAKITNFTFRARFFFREIAYAIRTLSGSFLFLHSYTHFWLFAKRRMP